jgi:hypothetical protein
MKESIGEMVVDAAFAHHGFYEISSVCLIEVARDGHS